MTTPEEKLRIREMKQRLRLKRLAKGLCADCNQPKLPDSNFCAKHLAYRKKYNAISNKKLRVKKKYDFTVCKSVGCTKLPEEGKRFCRHHLDLRAASHKRWREKNKEKGNCARCGTPLLDWGFGISGVTCVNCSENLYKRHLWK
jgi:hypothetical protein